MDIQIKRVIEHAWPYDLARKSIVIFMTRDRNYDFNYDVKCCTRNRVHDVLLTSNPSASLKSKTTESNRRIDHPYKTALLLNMLHVGRTLSSLAYQHYLRLESPWKFRVRSCQSKFVSHYAGLILSLLLLCSRKVALACN